MTNDRLDMDPPPRRSPRLSAEVEKIPHARPTASLLRPRPTDAQIARLRRDLAIYLAIEGGMSFRMTAKVWGLTHPGVIKIHRRMLRRKARI
jgi:hypothetical protein